MTTVRRTWIRHGNHYARVAVETVHPEYGPLLRGWIRCAGVEDTTGPGLAVHLRWELTDYDHTELEPVVGDYLVAERALLNATKALED